MVAALLGMATGFVRARATRLRYDHESGELMAGFSLSALLFLAFVITMYIVVIRMVKKQSKTDTPV